MIVSDNQPASGVNVTGCSFLLQQLVVILQIRIRGLNLRCTFRSGHFITL